MSDIVERLRELEAVESELACECDCPPEATANYRYAMTCAEAADEITRLRAALSTARADALEEAARVVAAMPRTYEKVKEDVDVLGLGKGMWTLTLNNGPKECAAAIRALKEGK